MPSSFSCSSPPLVPLMIAFSHVKVALNGSGPGSSQAPWRAALIVSCLTTLSLSPALRFGTTRNALIKISLIQYLSFWMETWIKVRTEKIFTFVSQNRQAMEIPSPKSNSEKNHVVVKVGIWPQAQEHSMVIWTRGPEGKIYILVLYHWDKTLKPNHWYFGKLHKRPPAPEDCQTQHQGSMEIWIKAQVGKTSSYTFGQKHPTLNTFNNILSIFLIMANVVRGSVLSWGVMAWIRI